MAVWIAGATGVTVAYLLGSIPTGYLAGRLLKGIDIREHGSKSTGATNVLRTLGTAPAVVVLAIDVSKGMAAVLLARWLFADRPDVLPWVVCLAGLAALLGHGRSIWLNFTGGKSAATGLGVLLALSWPVGLAAAAVFAALVAMFRLVSLGSILASLTAVAMVCVLEQPWPYRLLVIAGSVYVIVRHRANIGRLLNGTEGKIGR